MKKVKHIFLRKRKIIIPFTIVMIMVVALVQTMLVRALINDEDTVHIKSSDVENATLIIGTHLIYIGAMTEELYEVAVETQSQSNQYTVYYKSELAAGAWYEILSDMGLSDIMDVGSQVSDSVIEALNVRYHTKQDGITYDLMNGQAVCIFDLNSPYNLAENAELEAIAQQKEILNQKTEKNDSDTFYEKLLDDFMNTDMSNDETKQNDNSLAKLQQSYAAVAATDSDGAANIMAIMKKIDATRRVDVYGRLSEDILSALLDQASLQTAEDSDLVVNTDVVNAIGTAMESVAKKKSEYEADMITDGTSVLSRTEKNLLQQIVDAMDSENQTDLDTALNRFAAFQNVENGTTKDATLELDILQNVLIPAAQAELSQLINDGTNEDYEAAKAAGASQTALVQRLSVQQNAIGQALSQKEYFVKAAASRMTTDDAKAYFLQEVAAITTLMDQIPEDDLKPYTQEELRDYQQSIQSAYTDYNAGGTNEMDNLLEQKRLLQLEKLKALDNNDLTTAGQVDGQLDIINRRIEIKENELNAIIASATATPAEKAEALSQLGSGTAANTINAMKEQILTDLSDGDYTDLGSGIDGIAALVQISPVSTQSALKEIYQSLAAKKYLSDDSETEITAAMNQIETVVAENSGVFEGNDLSKEKIFQMVIDTMGDEYTYLSYEDQAMIAVNVSQYADYLNSSVLKETAVAMANIMYNTTNKYLYTKLKNETEHYIPVEKVAMCINYRYVYSDSGREATMEKGAEYYKFTVFHKLVERKDALTDEMASSAKFQEQLYIVEDYAKKTFLCNATYIDGSEYAIVYTDQMQMDYALEFYYRLVSASS